MGHALADRFPGLRLPTVNLDASTGFSVVLLTGAAAGFALMRLLLGLGEAGNFPASIKTVAEWFPKKERALATGIFNSGQQRRRAARRRSRALDHAPLGLAVGLHRHRARRAVLGLLVARVYRPPERTPDALAAAELAYIRSDPPERRRLPCRGRGSSRIGRPGPSPSASSCTDPIWWFYLFWLPDFFSRNHGLDLKSMGLPLVAIYLLADVGSIGGGWLSSTLIKRGWSVNARPQDGHARLRAWPSCPSSSPPRPGACGWRCCLVRLAAAAHQGWSANLYTLASDMFPRRAVGSVVGFGGMAGAVGGMFISIVVGRDPAAHEKLHLHLLYRRLRLPGRSRHHAHPGPEADTSRPWRRGGFRGMRPSSTTTSCSRPTSPRDLYHRFAARPADHRLSLPPAAARRSRADHRFRILTEIWLDGDHYKWRAMRANGVAERFCTGDATDWEKFEAWARTVPATLRNPLYHWTHLELKKPVRHRRSADPNDGARDLRPLQRAAAAGPTSSTQGLLRQFRWRSSARRTIPPTRSRHTSARPRDGPDTRVVPTWRPDAALAIERSARVQRLGGGLESRGGDVDHDASTRFLRRARPAPPRLSRRSAAAPPIMAWSRFYADAVDRRRGRGGRSTALRARPRPRARGGAAATSRRCCTASP